MAAKRHHEPPPSQRPLLPLSCIGTQLIRLRLKVLAPAALPGGTKLTDREPLQLNGAAPLPVNDLQTSQSAGSTGNHAVPENTARREQRRRLNGEPFESGSVSVQCSGILFNRRKMLQLAHGRLEGCCRFLYNSSGRSVERDYNSISVKEITVGIILSDFFNSNFSNSNI